MGTGFAILKHLRLSQNTYGFALLSQNTYNGPSPLPRPPSFESRANRKNFPVAQRLLQVEVQKIGASLKVSGGKSK
jgi:hypothetical protein